MVEKQLTFQENWKDKPANSAGSPAERKREDVSDA